MEGRPGRSCWQQEFQVRLRQAIVEKWMCLKWVQMGSMHREFNPWGLCSRSRTHLHCI